MLTEFVKGYIVLLVYFIICASLALALRKFVDVPRELFRKTLHMILLGSIFVLTYGFETWWVAALASIVFIIMVYPILSFGERIYAYSELLIERKPGEIKKSLVIVFFMFVVLIAICWGWVGEKYLIIASVLAWGLGDATAALIGKRFGKRYIEGRLVEGRKSLEGTIGMFLVSFITVMVVLVINSPVKWFAYVPISALTAAVCSLVELYTKGGMDTITCPFSAAAILIPLIHLWGV